jgi:hypothetical protein
MSEEDNGFDPKMFEKLNATQTKCGKTFIPINQRTVFVRVSYEGSPRYNCKDEDRYCIDREPVFGIVHWADEEGVSYYRYLTDSSGCELGVSAGEIEPYWDADPDGRRVGGLLFPDIQPPEDIASEMKRWKEHAKQAWEREQAEKAGGEVLALWQKREQARHETLMGRGLSREAEAQAIARQLLTTFKKEVES